VRRESERVRQESERVRSERETGTREYVRVRGARVCEKRARE
jgi:hypothetical protein